MSVPISMSSKPLGSSAPHADSESEGEPLWARIVGGLAGALGFALCVLLFGPVIGIVIAVAAAVLALVRHATRAAAIFGVAAAICAIALAASTIAIFISSLAFGEALVRLARAQRLNLAGESSSTSAHT
jgi:ABC-type dipeptide/oligopeptide/nickel transport system permease subunit